MRLGYCFLHNDSIPLGGCEVGKGVCSAQSHSAYQVSEGNKREQSCIVKKPPCGLTQTQQNSENYLGKYFLYSCLWRFNLTLSQPGLEEENY